jgi:hypothetical protein
MQTWPVSPAQHRPEDEEFISRFGGNGQTGSTNGSGADVVLDASSYASDERRANAVPMTKAPGQTWVQAATYSWNVPRPAAEANGVAASQNGRSAPPPDTSQTSEH